MYRRIISIVLLLIMVLTVSACKKNQIEAETTVVTTVETTVPEETIIPGPGTAINEFGHPDELFETEATETTVVKESEEATKPTTSKEPEETTKPTTSQETDETTKPTESTQPTTPAETKPQDIPAPTERELSDYEKYLNMSGDEQTAFIESFDSPITFLNWLEDAKKTHENQHPDIIVNGGSIDLENVTNSQ